jgi:hypothetical protein
MPVDKEFILFQSHGVDPFEFGHVEEAPIPGLCSGCHVEAYQEIQGAQSILSYSRARFPLPDGKHPVLFELNVTFSHFPRYTEREQIDAFCIMMNICDGKHNPDKRRS